jgi:segregation and condensation protein A
MQFLDLMKMLDLEVAGEFIVMAANLIYIKSRSLLPATVQPPEEETEEEDPRWELVRQLLEYKKFKEAAGVLHIREIEQSGRFTRAADPGAPPERPLADVSVFDLINAFNKVLKRLEKPEDLREIFEENFTVADKIDLILKMTPPGVSIRFEELFTESASRAEIVVTFLALLELIRLKQLKAVQPEPFAEIEIIRVES